MLWTSEELRRLYDESAHADRPGRRWSSHEGPYILAILAVALVVAVWFWAEYLR